MKLDRYQRDALLGPVEGMPSGDIENALVGVEIVVRLLLDATREDFLRWAEYHGAAGYDDELSVGEAEPAQMSDPWKLAYLSRMIRTLALDLGIGTEFDGAARALRIDRDSLLALLHGLCEIVAPPAEHGQPQINGGER